MSTLACSPVPEVRFGVSTAKIEEFKKNLCRYEVEGRRARTFYRIEWKNAHPLAENYLWTILSNKVSDHWLLKVFHALFIEIIRYPFTN